MLWYLKNYLTTPNSQFLLYGLICSCLGLLFKLDNIDRLLFFLHLDIALSTLNIKNTLTRKIQYKIIDMYSKKHYLAFSYFNIYIKNGEGEWEKELKRITENVLMK